MAASTLGTGMPVVSEADALRRLGALVEGLPGIPAGFAEREDKLGMAVNRVTVPGAPGLVIFTGITINSLRYHHEVTTRVEFLEAALLIAISTVWNTVAAACFSVVALALLFTDERINLEAKRKMLIAGFSLVQTGCALVGVVSPEYGFSCYGKFLSQVVDHQEGIVDFLGVREGPFAIPIGP